MANQYFQSSPCGTNIVCRATENPHYSPPKQHLYRRKVGILGMLDFKGIFTPSLLIHYPQHPGVLEHTVGD